MTRPGRLREDVGAWSVGSIAPEELDAFDQRCCDALSEQGGVWAPSEEIEVGGAGFRCTILNGSWTCDGIPSAVGWRASSATGFKFNNTKTFVQPIHPFPITNNDVETWYRVPPYTYQVNYTAPRSAWFELKPPIGSTLKSVTIYLQGIDHTELPPAVPSIQIVKVSTTTTRTSVTARIPDPSIDMAAYEEIHSITASCTEQVMDDVVYYAVLTGEIQNSPVAGRLYVYGLVMVYQSDSLLQAAG